ncbi:MAG: hypothetical protein AAB403_10795 [Planctomycetota bacterium]
MELIYRVKKSRKRWKEKSVARMAIVSILKKLVRRQWTTVRELRSRVKDLENKLAQRPEAQPAPPVPTHSKEQTRTLCVILVIHGVISFRSAPRILRTLLSFGLLAEDAWIPHFTSVIHWVLRLGLCRLKAVSRQAQRWIAIVDCSIDVGVQKALVVLRVNLDALAKREGALTLADVQCVGLKIGSTWNGETVQRTLTEIFERAGKPDGILKDGGTDLNKGVTLWREENSAKQTWPIADIGHVIANALKAEFSGLKAFEQFLEVVSRGSSRIRQTVLAILMPPKIRTKGRFQSISRVADWAEKMLEMISGAGRAPEQSVTTRLRRAFEGLSAQRAFIERLQMECRIASQVMALLKNQGLNQATYRKAKELIRPLPERSVLKVRVEEWLDRHLRIQSRLGMGQQALAVSSDIIESLFGKFKITLQRSPLAEMTSMVLALPALCGTVGAVDVQAALQQVSHQDLQTWTKANIPPTMQQFRRQTFDLRRGEWVPEIGKYG